MKQKIEIKKPEYHELPAPDPNKVSGHFLTRVVPNHESYTSYRVQDTNPLESRLFSQQIWELREIIAPKWIVEYTNDKEEMGYWEVLRWYAWQLHGSEMDLTPTDAERFEHMREVDRYRRYVAVLEEALREHLHNDMTTLYFEAMKAFAGFERQNKDGTQVYP